MGAKRCSECGAQLRLRSTLCPLCGAEEGGDATTAKRKQASKKRPGAKVVTVEDYQADMRRLRDELKRLRKAEAS
jgi:predicted amidophosphoribosyltransferase